MWVGLFGLLMGKKTSHEDIAALNKCMLPKKISLRWVKTVSFPGNQGACFHASRLLWDDERFSFFKSLDCFQQNKLS